MSRPFLAQWVGLGLALLLLFILISVNLYRDHGRTAQREQERLSTQARVVAENIEFQLSTIDLTLESVIKELSDGKDMFITQEAQAFHLAALADAMPGIRTIGILDAQGYTLASNRKELVGRNFVRRDYFRMVKDNPDAEMLYVSPPFKSVLDPYVLDIVRMIPGPKGQFAGIVFMALDPDYFNTLMASVLYAPDMWGTLTHADGQVFLTQPQAQEITDENLIQAGSLFVLHRDSGRQATVMAGSSFMAPGAQMVAQRTVSLEKIKMDKPLVIAIGRSLDDIFVLWRSDMLFRAMVFAVICMGSCLALRAYQQAQRRLDFKSANSEANLRATQENYQLIVENTADLVVKIDIEGRYTYVNPAFCELFGASSQQLLGQHYRREIVAADQHMADDHFRQLFLPPYAAKFTQREKTIQGIRHLQWTARTLFDQYGNVTEVVGIGRDLTEHMHRMDTLKDQAQRDFLTGLANRRYFMSLGEDELQRVRRYGKPLSLLMLDIDYFKYINDAHGHKVGDRVLRVFGETLLKTLRAIDIVGRVGGEEFAILLPETALHEAIDVAYRLKEAIAATDVELDSGAVLQATASIGVAARQGDRDLDLDDLLELADAALYQAKQSGRNTVCVADDRLLAQTVHTVGAPAAKTA